jgi:hypothetical protein
MQTLKSIIVFNSGSGGDLLKILCLDQLNQAISNHITESGRMRITTSQYFKKATQDSYWSGKDCQWDWKLIQPVENTHFWKPHWKRLSEKVCFIDYPDKLQPAVMEIYLEKVFSGNKKNLLDFNMYSIPMPLRKHINTDNVLEVFNRKWLQNLNAWRTDNTLAKIELEHIIDPCQCKKIILYLLNIDSIDHTKFSAIHNEWLTKNKKFVSLIGQA